MENLTDKSIQKLYSLIPAQHLDAQYIVNVALLALQEQISENPEKILKEYGTFFANNLEWFNGEHDGKILPALAPLARQLGE